MQAVLGFCVVMPRIISAECQLLLTDASNGRNVNSTPNTQTTERCCVSCSTIESSGPVNPAHLCAPVKREGRTSQLQLAGHGASQPPWPTDVSQCFGLMGLATLQDRTTGPIVKGPTPENICVPHQRRCLGPNRRVRIEAARAPDPTHDREGQDRWTAPPSSSFSPSLAWSQ